MFPFRILLTLTAILYTSQSIAAAEEINNYMDFLKAASSEQPQCKFSNIHITVPAIESAVWRSEISCSNTLTADRYIELLGKIGKKGKRIGFGSMTISDFYYIYDILPPSLPYMQVLDKLEVGFPEIRVDPVGGGIASTGFIVKFLKSSAKAAAENPRSMEQRVNARKAHGPFTFLQWEK